MFPWIKDVMKKIIGMNLLLVLFIASAAFADVNIPNCSSNGNTMNCYYTKYPTYSNGKFIEVGSSVSFKTDVDEDGQTVQIRHNGILVDRTKWVSFHQYICDVTEITYDSIPYVMSLDNCHGDDASKQINIEYRAVSCDVNPADMPDELCQSIDHSIVEIIQYRSNGTLKFDGNINEDTGLVNGECYDRTGMRVVKNVNDASKCK